MVKPEIHSDAELWDLEEETGLPIFRAFVGIWNFSDREGRFEWKPRQLKALVLPFWNGDFSRVLDALATRGFLVPYASGSGRYGVVRTFLKHQSPNGREVASELPEPPAGYKDFPIVSDASSTREPRDEHASATRHDGMVLYGSGQESIVRISDPPKAPQGVGPESGADVPAPKPQRAASGGHFADFDVALGEAAEALSWKPAPKIGHSMRGQIVERCREYATESGKPYLEACRVITREGLVLARSTGKSPASALLEVEPGKGPPRRFGNGRLERAAATTGKDFADAEPLEEQLKRLEKV